MACPTVPFGKKRQRHGKNRSKEVVPDRAFCKKTSKARSKLQRSSRPRPCLLQKSIKGTVKTVRQMAQPTVPFAKKRQRHGRNREADGTTDRAFYKKASKARSKPEPSSRVRPCLLQKSVKGTVKIMSQTAQPTVPFTKKRQRHGRNREADGTTDRAFCKKASKARSEPRGRGRTRFRM